MIRIIVFTILFATSSHCFAGSRNDLDEYNEETTNLLDDLDSCLVRVDYSIERAQSIGYAYGHGYALYLKGYIHRMQDELGKAFLANLKGLSVLQHVDDERATSTLMGLYLNTGEILEKHFKYEEAVQYYQEGLTIAEEENLSRRIIDLNYNAGYAYFLKGELGKASDLIYQAYKLAKAENDEHTMVNALNLMGLAFRDNHRYDTAALFFHKMLAYEYQELSADKYKGRAYHNLANTYAQAGDTAKAITAFHEALKYKEARGRAQELFLTENDLAELLYMQGDYQQASQIIQNCISNYPQMRLSPDHYKVFDIARKINAAMADYHQADQYASRYFEENEHFINQQEKLIEIRDQFKMEVLTASFFSELERNRRITQLNRFILWISILAVLVIAYLKIRQIRIEKVVEKAVGELSGHIQ